MPAQPPSIMAAARSLLNSSNTASSLLLLRSSAPRTSTFALPCTSIPRIAGNRDFGIKSMNRPKASRFNHTPDLPVLTASPAAALARKQYTLPLRAGALAVKKGMSAWYDAETGKRTPCTILQLDRVQVVGHKKLHPHGYFAVQVGFGYRHPRNITKPMLGVFSAAEVSPKERIREFRVRDEAGLLPVGEMINADWFQVGQFVDARANSRGMGFAGVMKRWGMHGQDRSHGVSLTHRSMGSAGQGQGGGSRVYPGKKMAGRMGNVQVTTQNLKVLEVDAEKGVVIVHGMLSR